MNFKIDALINIAHAPKVAQLKINVSCLGISKRFQAEYYAEFLTKINALVEERDASMNLARICAQRSRRLLARIEAFQKYSKMKQLESHDDAVINSEKTYSQVQATLLKTIERGRANAALAAKLEAIIGALQQELPEEMDKILKYDTVRILCAADNRMDAGDVGSISEGAIRALLGGSGKQLVADEQEAMHKEEGGTEMTQGHDLEAIEHTVQNSSPPRTESTSIMLTACTDAPTWSALRKRLQVFLKNVCVENSETVLNGAMREQTLKTLNEIISDLQILCRTNKKTNS
ncbi:hypothetical protein CEUSTIGMA_g1754.t1 [Chlamydomonas eustigma]|uniref:Uncharacterized protein n=1 Tax=Chlamydomonas eustigma TaxID=1157962 RepID=A0A250WU33_9CHLO|nr:hypothetical protein CEUSTIGMA_g1754.t1 [Chlamydomonas eustigma]|eukprot:GAX74305.1 hypothetical protein CEUSTIGMA_g1754.t1 [Chlamydomonas eustigma]